MRLAYLRPDLDSILILDRLMFSGIPGAGGHQANLIDDEEGGAGGEGEPQSQSRTQMLLEEEYNIEQLQEREKAIRQLEVNNRTRYSNIKYSIECMASVASVT